MNLPALPILVRKGRPIKNLYLRKENKNLSEVIPLSTSLASSPTTIYGQEVQISKWKILLADLGDYIPFPLKVQDPNGEDAVTRS